MSPAGLGSVYRYGLAVLFFSVGLLCRIPLDQIAPGRLPFLTFFPPVLVATYFLGLGPGVLVLALSSLAPWWIWVGVPLEWYVGATLAFFVFAGINVYLISYSVRAQLKLREHEEQLKLINCELGHRIKNLFAITSSVCQSTIKSARSPEAAAEAVAGRIQSIAAAQDLLSATASAGADFGQLVNALVATVSPEPKRLRAEGPIVILRAEDSTPFALILHELATNAVKHGAWSVPAGTVVAEWSVNAVDRGSTALDFRWSEHDGPPVALPSREGLGTKLIRRGLSEAEIDYDFAPDGLRCRVQLKL